MSRRLSESQGAVRKETSRKGASHKGAARKDAVCKETARKGAACELAVLADLIEKRRRASPSASYTSQLLHGDEDALLKKIVEEAGETALAAKGGDKNRLTEELADICYHCLVVMARYNISMGEVAAALRKRRGQSGLAEKSARKEK